jgi:hypothetical protein
MSGFQQHYWNGVALLPKPRLFPAIAISELLKLRAKKIVGLKV